MDAQQIQMRKQKGIEIAKTGKVRLDGNRWLVPSQSINKYYDVILRIDKSECNCPDYQERGMRCKHIFAVEYTIQSQRNPDGSVTVTQTKKITYSQEWSAYNKAQVSELKLFDELLKDLLQEVEEPIYKFGRPRLPLREELFCSIVKVYSQLSSRRASTLYGYAVERGFIQHKPHFNAISKMLNREEITPILKDLVYLTSMPLRDIEAQFAIDSSGFRTTNFNAYYTERHHVKKYNSWLKAHICIGTKTNIITAVDVTIADGNQSGDNPHFIPLVNKTHENGFAIQEISADKAYNAIDNYNAVNEIGAVAYIPFKSNATGKGKDSRGNRARLWRKMFHYFQLNQEEFYEHYHKRSNVETTFSAIKKKLGETIKSKNEVAQKNELLCKIVAYNITVLIAEMHSLGVNSNFNILGHTSQ